jgi:hypothetical protein
VRNIEMVRRSGALGIGIAVTEFLNHYIDFLLFPAVVGILGVWKSWPVLLIISLTLNYFNILAYRKSGVSDVLKWFEQIGEMPAQGWGKRMLSKLLKLGFWPTVLLLTLEDPAKGFVYARQHVLYSKFTPTDIFLYFAANVLGVSIWTWGTAGMLQILKLLWQSVL